MIGVKPKACDGCPAYNKSQGFAPAEGPPDAALAVVGQGPGEQEAWHSRPFVANAPSGWKLRRWLTEAGIDPETVYLTNVVWCRTINAKGKNREPSRAEIEFCRQAHWGPDLDRLTNLRVVVPCGVAAISTFIPGAKANAAGGVREWERDCKGSTRRAGAALPGRSGEVRPDVGGEARDHRGEGGDPRRDDLPRSPRPAGRCACRDAASDGRAVDAAGAGGCAVRHVGGEVRPDEGPDPSSHDAGVAVPAPAPVWLVPILHPAYILRGEFREEWWQVDYLRRARDCLEHGWRPVNLERDGPPGAVLSPAPAEALTWLTSPHPEGVTVDIENAGHLITIIGLCDIATRQSIVLNFRIGTDPYMWEGRLREVVAALYDLLADPDTPKVFQNGQAHDIFLLELTGFHIQGYTFDTMTAAHASDPEAKKALETLYIKLAGGTGWKRMLKEESKEGK